MLSANSSDALSSKARPGNRYLNSSPGAAALASSRDVFFFPPGTTPSFCNRASPKTRLTARTFPSARTGEYANPTDRPPIQTPRHQTLASAQTG